MVPPEMNELQNAARELAARAPATREFADWPELAEFVPRNHRQCPALPLIKSWNSEHVPETQRFHEAVLAAADTVRWERSWSARQVGADFMNRYGHFELAGPNGHFRCWKLRIFVSFWGESLYYPWHRHAAEEIYLVTSGSAEFHSQGQSRQTLGPLGCCRHSSWQPHEMTTFAQPVLTLVMWKGPGLCFPPQM